MRVKLAAAAFTLLSPVLAMEMAAARPLEAELPKDARACWSRAYDDAHLKAHPRQQVTGLKLVHLPEDWPQAEGGRFFVDLKFNLRKRVKAQDYDYSISAFCGASKSGLLCVNEWDAATYRIDRASGGIVIRNAGTIIANPIPYDAEEVADGAVRITAAPDDKAWLLTTRTSDASCRIE